ncbi:CAP domain-containing protein [Flavobacterium psychrotolerans]|uniref:CAP domain-containing protein n=1 Tax=Flavobacterium psychrotolerans TaxID=2169410 RepID=A0A2U1JGV9_9FLAO|nr:CAP domain-containing protein [Flavobacterium psychrotolerans]PWA04376.1 CAP domain-containing protein [Flavobacterium psychrotolerans]
MKNKSLRALLPLVVVFAFLSCTTNSPQDVVLPQAKLVQNYAYQPEEMELADLINEYRVSKGLIPLQIINHISFKSEEHNEYMIAKNIVNHDLFEERSQNIIQLLGAVKVNENIAYNFSTPNSVLHAWLNSPGHKANIEGNFTHFGLSITVNSVTGSKYYTNMFMKR